MSFYDSVLRELLVALGGALFVGNLLALIRRRMPASLMGDVDDAGDADGHAPAVTDMSVKRSVYYMLLGFVVMVWGIASIAAG